MTGWVFLPLAASVKGVCVETLLRWVRRGKVQRCYRPKDTPKGTRLAAFVWWPDMQKQERFAGRGDHRPVTDETWARFCEVWDQVGTGRSWPMTQGESQKETTWR